MKQYLSGLKHILDNGTDIEGRNGKTRSIFGMQMHYNLEDGFPAVTTKKLAFNVVKGELLGFLRGYNHIKQFHRLGVRIWDANAEAWGKDGQLGRMYGVQWRSWKSYQGELIDQIDNVIKQIKKDPYSRRHIVTSWNPGELDNMALAPCHVLFQFNVADGKLSLGLYQRSADMFLGAPFNIASYSLLLCMIAKITDLEPGTFIHTLGDAHIYHDHFKQVKMQLERTPLPLPQLIFNSYIRSIDNFKSHHIELINYKHHDAIKAKMIV